MTNSKEKIEFFKNVYPGIWKNRVEYYGYNTYQKSIVNFLSEFENIIPDNKVLECCIGTGSPIALNLKEKTKFDIYGLDISKELLLHLRENVKDIDCVVANAEKIPYKDSSFSLTYCFQSSWYIPNISNLISEMVRVTKKDGFVCFDFINKYHPDILYQITFQSAKTDILQVLSNYLGKKRLYEKNYRTLTSVNEIKECIRELRIKNYSILSDLIDKNNNKFSQKYICSIQL